MKKLFMVCTLVLLVLSVSSRTQASPTITCVEIQEVRTLGSVENRLDYTDAQPGDGTYFVPGGIPSIPGTDYYRNLNEDDDTVPPMRQFLISIRLVM